MWLPPSHHHSCHYMGTSFDCVQSANQHPTEGLPRTPEQKQSDRLETPVCWRAVGSAAVLIPNKSVKSVSIS